MAVAGQETLVQRELLSQITDTVVMISPDHFGFNPQTADSNAFQRTIKASPEEIKRQALAEFQQTVGLLEANGVRVLVLPSNPNVFTPDAVFPNNWFSHHDDGTLVLYPMLAQNRRQEKQPVLLRQKLKEAKIPVKRVVDLSDYENWDQALEGTGALVLDRMQKVAFAVESPRATRAPFAHFCRELDYKGIFFHARDQDGQPIYHTNVIMSIGNDFAVLCPDSITDRTERTIVEEKLQALKKEIIPVTLEQMKQYGANILQLGTDSGEPIIILSRTALNSYTEDQKTRLSKHGRLVPFDIPVIETIGGGSARCILAEVFG